MAFTLTTATLITQTGTDADLSGLSSIPGVTTAGGDQQTLYTIPDTVTLKVEGELNINPDTECLFLANTVKYPNQQDLWLSGSSCVFNVNGNTAVSWQDDDLYSRNTFLRFNRTSSGSNSSNSSESCWYLESNATLNWVGGVATGAPVVYWNGTHKLIEGRWVGLSGHMFRVRGTIPTDGFRNFTIQSHRTVIDVSSTVTFDKLATVDSLIEGRDRRIFTNFSGQSEIDTWTRNGYTRTFINNTTGMNLRVNAFTNSTSQRGGQIPLYKDYEISVIDADKVPLEGAAVRVRAYNDGNRINYPALADAIDEELTFIDLTSIADEFAIADVDGVVTGRKLLKTWSARIAPTHPTGNTISRFCNYYNDAKKQDLSLVEVVVVTYEQSLSVSEVSFDGAGTLEREIVMFPDFVVTNTDKFMVGAYTTIDSAYEFYDAAKLYLANNLNANLAHHVAREGVLLNAGDYDVNIDATAAAAIVVDTGTNVITIKSSNYIGDMTTTGVITLVNGALFTGTRTDFNGTILPPLDISISNIEAGSRMCIFNETTQTEVFNGVVTGNTYADIYDEGSDYITGDIIRVRLAWVNGATAKLNYVGTAVATPAGWTLLADQQDDIVYNEIGIDGSTITQFTADYINNEVDLVISSDFTVSSLYAWWVNNLATTDGISNFFGGLTALDLANFRIDVGIVDMFLDNTTSVSVYQTDNRRIYRSDELYPVKVPTSSGYGLDVVWRNTVLVTGMTAAQETKLFSLDTDNLDVAVSTRSTFDPTTDVVANVTLVDTVTANTDMRGTDGANVVVPDNASIADIQTEIDTQLSDARLTGIIQRSGAV